MLRLQGAPLGIDGRGMCVCADGEPDQSAVSEHQSPVTQLFQMQRTWQELKSWTNDHENSQNRMDQKILLSSCWFLQVASLEIHSQLSLSGAHYELWIEFQHPSAMLHEVCQAFAAFRLLLG